MGIMQRVAAFLTSTALLTFGGAFAADGAMPSTKVFPGCKVLSVVVETNDDINSANPNHVVTDVRYWQRTVTTLKCKRQTHKIVGLWYPVR